MFSVKAAEDVGARIAAEKDNAVKGLKEKLEWIWQANTGQLDKDGDTIRFYE